MLPCPALLYPPSQVFSPAIQSEPPEWQPGAVSPHFTTQREAWLHHLHHPLQAVAGGSEIPPWAPCPAEQAISFFSFGVLFPLSLAPNCLCLKHYSSINYQGALCCRRASFWASTGTCGFFFCSPGARRHGPRKTHDSRSSGMSVRVLHVERFLLAALLFNIWICTCHALPPRTATIGITSLRLHAIKVG